MEKWLKRIRGAIGMGLTWAVAWAPVGAIIGLMIGLVVGVPSELSLIVASYVRNFAVMGLVGGAAFSTVLSIAEGRRRFDEMSLPRFAGWGAVGGFLLSVVLLSTGGSIPVYGAVVVASVLTLLGAGSAAGSLALARRAEDKELLEAGDEALELTEGG